MRKNLTLRYTFRQCAHWAAAAGVVSFATAFLREKGFAASQIGILLAAGNLLSCAIGNFVGGQILDAFSVRTLLWADVAMATAGTLVFFLTVDRHDKPMIGS